MVSTEVFIVTARFDMREHGYLDVKPFLKRKNAVAFALEKKDEFIQQIPNGELDLVDTMDCFSEEDEENVFYGVCKDGENFVEIRITPDSLTDV